MTTLYNKSALIHILVAISSLIFTLVLFNQKAFSHPGNTDSSGGHHCWTNCDYWGYEYGEYHYHNGGYTSYNEPDYYAQGIENGAAEADERESDIRAAASTTGREDGYNDGSEGNSESPDPDPTNICDIDFTFEGFSPEEYQDGFHESFRENCYDSYKSSYNEAYETGYTEGQEDFNDQVLQNKDDSADSRSDDSGGSWGWLLGLGAFYGGIFGISFVGELIRERKS